METALRVQPSPRYAGFGIRAFAHAIDVAVSTGLGALFGAGIERLNLAYELPLALLGGQAIGLFIAVACPALFGRSPGKWFFGLRIVGPDGKRDGLGWKVAFLRWLVTYASGLAFGLGYFAVITDPEKRAWHDQVAGTHVFERQLGGHAPQP